LNTRYSAALTLSNWKPLSLIFGIVCGGFVGGVLGFVPAICASVLATWAYPDDPSAGSAGDIVIATVPGGAMFGAALGGCFIATRPRLFLMTVLPFAILILGLLLTLGALHNYDVPRNYVLKVIGTQGADFIGEVRVDGEFHKLKGKLPAEFEYRALEVEFGVALPDAKEGQTIAVEVLIDGQETRTDRRRAAWARKNNIKGGDTRFGKYTSFGYSDLFGGTVRGDSDLLPEHWPAFRK
jgi:hypothetical protein